MKKEQYEKSIWWIKKDIRLKDNIPLISAIEKSNEILPIYIFEPSLISHPQTSNFHLQAQIQALRSLNQKIKQQNSRIIIVKGEIPKIFENLKQKIKFQAIFSYQETGAKITYDRDKRFRRWCKTNKIDWVEKPKNGIIRGDYERGNRMNYWNRRIKNKKPQNKPSKKLIKEKFIATEKVNKLNAVNPKKLNDFDENKNLKKVTEERAQETLQDFLFNRGLEYFGGISSMNTAPRACSRLSTHLAWGTVSLREVYHKTKDRIKELKTEESKKAGEWTRSLKMFLSRLYWHDHFIQKLEDEPEIEFKPMNKAFSEERIPYKKDKGKIKKWLKGKTGYPLVDACMKCFKKTGFLNFRMRAMIVSFACHVLHISWKEIKYPMARLMADYIPGIHIPQLQMQAGITGINSIRCYNPTKQTKENDPKCSFIKKWIPKMKNYTPSEIINHPEEGLFEIENYPNPIVNYREKRNEMLSALYKIKNSSAAKKETEKVYKKHGSRRRKNQKSN